MLNGAGTLTRIVSLLVRYRGQPGTGINMKNLQWLKLNFLSAFLLVNLGLISSCNWTTNVSVSTTGEQATTWSSNPALSPDGRYVVFRTKADNLVPDDVEGNFDVFLHDTATGTTERVSVNSEGEGGALDSGGSAISEGGRYVAFNSSAFNLIEEDRNGRSDIFVRDREAGVTSRISESSLGVAGNDTSSYPVISRDGRYIAFWSHATNLVDDDMNGFADIFFHDRETGTTSRISVDSSGVEGDWFSGNPAISADGRYVAFESASKNLVANDTNNRLDVFLHDRDTGITSRVSVDSAGQEGNDGSYAPVMSGDARYLAFYSQATNLVPDDTNNQTDAFVHDRLTGVTSRVSVDSDENQANNTSNPTAITDDGRLVFISSSADNLVNNDTNGVFDVFVRDRLLGTTRRVSETPDGQEANSGSLSGPASSDGRYVVFRSYATNLVSNDANGYDDIFITSVPRLTVTSVSPDILAIGETATVTITGTEFFAGAIPHVDGITFSNVVIADEGTITATASVSGAATEGSRGLSVALPGTGPGQFAGSLGTCIDCLTFIKVNCGCGCPQ